MNKEFYEDLFTKNPLGYLKGKFIFQNNVFLDIAILDTNLSFENLTGLNKDLLSNLRVKNNFFNEIDINFSNIILEAQLNQSIHNFKFICSETSKWIELQLYFTDENNFYFCLKDISNENKHLIELEEKYTKILQVSREIVLILQDNKIVFFNKSLERITKYSKDELINMDVDHLILKDNINLSLNAYNESSYEDYVHPYQFKMYGKNNKTLWLEISSSEITWNGKKSILCFLTDITKRKEYELALYESEKRKTSLIDSMNDLIFVLNSDFEFVEFYTPKHQKLLIEPKFFLNRKITEIDFPKVALDSIIKTLELINETKIAQQVEYAIETPDFTEWFQAMITFIDGTENHKPEFLCVVRDITKLKEAENEIKIERDLFSAGPVMNLVCEFSNEFKIKRISENVEQILGYNNYELISKSFLTFIHPEDSSRIVDAFHENIKNNIFSFDFSYRLKNKAGDYVWFYDFVQVLKNTKGEISEIRGYLFNQTQIKDMETQLIKQNDRLEDIIKATNASTWEWNIKDRTVAYNDKWSQVSGYTLEEINNWKLSDWTVLIHPKDSKKNVRLIKKLFSKELDYYSNEFRIKHKNGKWIWILSKGRVSSWDKNNKPEIILGLNIDITKRKLAEEKIRELYYKDPLTNLYNRRYIFEKFEEVTLNKKFSIALIDIDYFKKINDKFGHLAGDFILKEISKFIKSFFSERNIITRYGGEEFLIIVPHHDKEFTFKKLSEILNKLNKKFFSYKNEAIRVTFSGGITDNYREISDKSSLDFFIDEADSKLYQAKKMGRNIIIY